MVALDTVRASNALIRTTLSRNLVAIFVGATSGIEEATLKAFVEKAVSPRVYIVGRSQAKGDRVVAECEALNAEGSYTYITADMELMRNVDAVAAKIKEKETVVNILFMSQGDPNFERIPTPEGLNVFYASPYYARTLLAHHLLPLLNTAASSPAPANFARVITVASGAAEGAIVEDDVRAERIPLTQFKPHFATVVTLTLEALAARAPGVAFVHDFPGFVRTPYIDRMRGVYGVLVRAMSTLAGAWIAVPIEESAARHLFEATSAVYGGAGVRVDGLAPAKGVDGEVGGLGVYSVDEKGEPAGEKVVQVLREYREAGWVQKMDKFWKEDVGKARGSPVE